MSRPHAYNLSNQQVCSDGDERRLYRIVAPFADDVATDDICPYTLDVTKFPPAKPSTMRPVSSCIALRMPNSFHPATHATPDWTPLCRFVFCFLFVSLFYFILFFTWCICDMLIVNHATSVGGVCVWGGGRYSLIVVLTLYLWQVSARALFGDSLGPSDWLRAKYSPPLGYHAKILHLDTFSTNDIFEGIWNTFTEITYKKYLRYLDVKHSAFVGRGVYYLNVVSPCICMCWPCVFCY